MGYTHKDAAVLVLRELSTDTLLLTKRTDFLADHPGEICFPGGRWEFTDADLQMTARRECFEELGFEVQPLLLSPLTPVITLKDIKIHPWYGEIDVLPEMVINQEEVDSVLKLPFHLVKEAHRYQPFEVIRGDFSVTTLKFDYDDAFIWGATAKIMQHLSKRTS